MDICSIVGMILFQDDLGFQTGSASPDCTWFGISDRKTEGSFVYESNGDPIRFSKWQTRQPDDHGSNEDCLELFRFAGWNDCPCSMERRYVCEINV